MDANINDIFDRKIEVGPIMQFDLLQRLIEEFIKRQKAINDKVNNLEYKISSMAVADDNVLKYFDDSNINFDLEKDFSINKDKDNNTSNNNIINNENENKEENNKEKIIKAKSKNKKDYKNNYIKGYSNINININDFKNNNNNDLNNNDDDKNNKIDSPNSHNSNDRHYSKLFSRMDKLEIIVKELTKKTINSNNEYKVNMEQLRSDISEIKNNDEKIISIEKNISKMKKALSEYNILDYFKTENSKENPESENKNENLKSKIFSKKLDLIESKIKENEENIFKLKKGLTDANNLITSHKNNYNDFVKEISSNLNEVRLKENNDINNLKNIINGSIEEIKNEIKNELVKQSENQNKKDKEIQIESIENNGNNISSKLYNEKLNDIKEELKNYINKNLSDNGKYLKSLIKNLDIDNIRKDLINIHQELNNKLSRSDLDYIDIKLNEFETKLNNINLQIEMIKKDVNICNDTCSKSVKMIEYLSGQVVQVYQPDLDRSQKEEIMKKFNSINDAQSKNLVNKIDFDNEIKNIYKKIEQTLEVESENYKFIQHIENKLKFFSTQNELRTMEQCIMNIIEELKNEFSRKFMDKPEILKNLKILELQIKNIYENSGNLHNRDGDNWLLAKKPLNSYLCASCESYIGELKNKNIFLPWNKIPPQENKKYRMGNGFSRMLQLVNMDLMKNAEKINNNLTIKIDDKKINYEMHKQLPRIGSQMSVRHLNSPNNSTFSPINKDNDNNRLNNSADGMENIEIINNYNNYQELEEQEKERNSNLNNDKEDNPKVIRIFKKNKKDKRDNN